jgi:hypothetical protein
MNDPVPATSSTPESQALLDAVSAMLVPLAQLAVSRGIHFAEVEERLKLAFVQAARDAHPGGQAHRKVSRIATATGINRREVTRLVNSRLKPPSQKASLALRVFVRWTTDPQFQSPDGIPLALPRLGGAPSFESLAALVTRDVHARSLLDDMLRLKLAHWDVESDQVALSTTAFAPKDDEARLLSLLGSNVGSHLRAFVDIVDGEQSRHFEQAIWGYGLSADSMLSMRPLVKAQWQKLIRALGPELQQRVDADQTDGEEPPGEVRIGLYMYAHEREAAAPGSEGDDRHEDT